MNSRWASICYSWLCALRVRFGRSLSVSPHPSLALTSDTTTIKVAALGQMVVTSYRFRFLEKIVDVLAKAWFLVLPE
jgi:hypothetical protein